MKLSAKHLLATLGMLSVLAVAPTSAFAGDSIYIDVPGISIGFHGDRHSNKHHRKHYNKRYNRQHYDGRRYERRKYRQKRNRYYDDNYYNDRKYDRRYNNSYRNNSYRNNNYRNDGYRAQVCPIDGYSSYYDRSRNCYEHKGHYHCE